ncbi:carotenoid cleavage dioxygenase 7, chloroplastic [Rutidosis leptorrhynchoides]|uniref:carotenoid cleavage dioxygenase 7, chloroplastic n=1 Tax=Rutidosis leptorrhynchoides TaxID=125765 RepID=UPI003A9A3C3D
MQAKAFNFAPLKLSSPAIKLPPPKAILFPDRVPRPPTQEVSTSVEDEKTTAYWDYQFLFISQRTETDNPISLRITEGSIPSDFPLGTYYLTGPGLFKDDHGSTVHPLDGHGYLRAFTIDGVKGEVKFMAKYIQTKAQVEEHDRETGEWRFTHRGPFSVLKNGKKFGNTKVMKNVANTSVLKWGDRLFCLWEGGAPYEIEPTSLKTIGKFDLMNVVDGSSTPSNFDNDQRTDGVNFLDVATNILRPILYGVFNMPPKRLLSHYKIDASRNRLLMMSCNAEDMLLPRSTFTLYEFDGDFKMLQKQEFNIPEHLMIHDWAFTDSHYILFGNRIKLDILGSMTAVCGITPMISALSLNPSKSTSPIYLLPRFPERNGTRRDWKVPIEAPSQTWVLHVGNAFEETDHNGHTQIQIQASGCSYKWFNFHKLFGYNWQSGNLDPSIMNVDEGERKLSPHLFKVSIELNASGECEKCSMNPLNDTWDKSTDFPVINSDFGGTNNTYMYASTSLGARRQLPNFPFDTVVKFNIVKNTTRTWSVGPRRFIGEPIFVSKGTDEDDGYLLVVEYAVSEQKCYLAILDAKKIGETNEVVARLEVPKHMNFPLGFHGFWAPADS